MARKQKTVVIGAGPVGSLAALYAANRGDDVQIYELRSGESLDHLIRTLRLAAPIRNGGLSQSKAVFD